MTDTDDDDDWLAKDDWTDEDVVLSDAITAIYRERHTGPPPPTGPFGLTPEVRAKWRDYLRRERGMR